jgi:CRISPR-associated protein Cas2
MLEIAPGVYTSPHMSDGVRQRVWEVCLEWSGALSTDGGVLMTWRDVRKPSGQGLAMIGFPRADITDVDGIWLARSPNADASAEPG